MATAQNNGVIQPLTLFTPTDSEMRDTDSDMSESVGATQILSDSKRIRSRRTREAGRRQRVTAHHDERCYDSDGST
eukprot:CAMPEP_0171645862 /NCGR_PEP_ID=MMETSP0990-20121206/34371_1 /TAXON_ID=483369 /ORGANISM="non described non described, Strain CCMP2098" /LENGTH=75 /DNA_ID=CAMNT_0012222491 /DNA_START=56 /DNA_END=283 /DNA_ORIENTATION=-